MHLFFLSYQRISRPNVLNVHVQTKNEHFKTKSKLKIATVHFDRKATLKGKLSSSMFLLSAGGDILTKLTHLNVQVYFTIQIAPSDEGNQK